MESYFPTMINMKNHCKNSKDQSHIIGDNLSYPLNKNQRENTYRVLEDGTTSKGKLSAPLPPIRCGRVESVMDNINVKSIELRTMYAKEIKGEKPNTCSN